MMMMMMIIIIIITIISEKYIYKVVEKTGHARTHITYQRDTHGTHTHTHVTQMKNSTARSLFVLPIFYTVPSSLYPKRVDE